MSIISRRQASAVRRAIRKRMHKNFIPVHSDQTTISMGDLLEERMGETVRVDGGRIPREYRKVTSSKEISMDLKSASLKSFSAVGEGELIGKQKIAAGKTGLKFGFEDENQMVLLLRNLRRDRLADFVNFKRYILSRYTRRDLSARVFVVDEVLEAGQFFLQFGSKRGGDFGLMVDLPFGSYTPALAADAKIEFAWQKDTGFSIDAREGGVLGYRVSSIKLMREQLNSRYLDRLSYERDEVTLLDELSMADRKAIASDGGFAFVDRTDSFIIDQLENVLV